MTKQEVEFIIKPDGSVELTITGAKGKQCLPIAEVFKILGETLSDKATAEFYDKDDERQITISRG